MKFSYEGFEINLLDTPGHQDFSEDTYRVLTAVDSALMLIDGAKGVEAQTKKLLEVLNSEAIVDSHLADNLVPLLALVGGEIKTDKTTGHIRSNIYVCEKFLDVKFLINEEKNQITVM